MCAQGSVPDIVTVSYSLQSANDLAKAGEAGCVASPKDYQVTFQSSS